MRTPDQAAAELGAQLPDRVSRLPGASLAWLRERREAAAHRLATRGFPGRRQEQWRYTNVEPIFEHSFEPADRPVQGLVPGDVEELFLDDPECLRLVMVNGFVDPKLSRLPNLPAGLQAGSMARMLDEQPELIRPFLPEEVAGPSGFDDLNDAYHTDGAFVRVAPGARIDRPVDIIYLSIGLDRPTAQYPRSIIALGAGAGLRVSERFLSIGDSRYLTGAHTRVAVGENAELVHHRVQQESRQAFHVCTLDVSVAAGGRYRGHSLALGSRIGRTDITVTYTGEGAGSELNGLFLAHDGQLQDFHTNVEHAVPGCTTDQRFKGILSGQGRGVFDGRFHVHQDAQHTDASMRNDNLLLSRNAEVDTKPQLEIYADDVKCSHGATVGQLDPAALFYLRSRGIGLDEARHLLTWGFAADLLDDMGGGEIHDRMERALRQHLETHHV